LSGRKVIGPPIEGFQRPAGTLPGFFWVQVQCQQAPGGSLTPAIELMWPSIRAHARFVEAAQLQAKGVPQVLIEELLSAVKDWAIDLAKGAPLAALAKLLDVFNVAVPGLDGVVQRAVKRALDLYQTLRKVTEGGDLDQGLQPAEPLAEQLLRMTHPKVPLLVVVEDAHLMDDGLAEVLLTLAKPNRRAPVLVVTTAWPEGKTRTDYQQFRDNLLPPAGPADGEPPRATLIGTDTDPPFPTLGLADRVSMVGVCGPQTSELTRMLIAGKWENPYALQLALTGPPLTDYLRDEAYVVTENDLVGMPKDIEGLYQARWDELPTRISGALTAAAGALPQTGDTGAVSPYIAGVVADAAAQSGLLAESKILVDSDAVVRALAKAVDPYQWSRLQDPALDLLSFREWALERIAYNQFKERAPHVQHDFQNKVIDLLADRIEQDSQDQRDGDAAALPLARWLLALDAERNDRVATIAALTIADSLSETRPNEGSSDVTVGA